MLTSKNGSPNGTQMGPKQKMGPQMGPKMGPWLWDMPNLAWDMPNLAWDGPNMGHAQPGHGTGPTWHGTCPTWAWDMPNLDQGHAHCPWSMDMPNQWARTAQGPTNGPEQPRVQQMGPNGPGSNKWARTAQGPTNGPERPKVWAGPGQYLGPGWAWTLRRVGPSSKPLCQIDRNQAIRGEDQMDTKIIFGKAKVN